MADVPVAPAVARSRSIGGRLNSAPGQLRYRQTVDDRGGARHCSVLEDVFGLGSVGSRTVSSLPNPTLTVLHFGELRKIMRKRFHSA
jgi:hypothetical protein